MTPIPTAVMNRLMVGSNWDPATQMCGSKTHDGHDHDDKDDDHDGHDHDDKDHDGHDHDDDHDGHDHDSQTKDDTTNDTQTASKSPRAGSLLQHLMIALAVVLVA